MAKKIKLVGGKEATVDDEDFEELNKYKWYAQKYAIRQIRTINGKQRQKAIRMHRQIMNAKPGEEIDHINHDGLDNRRCNLRLCNRSQNQINSGIQKNNTSGLKGVHWSKKARKWEARIMKNNKRIYLGVFDSKEEAGRAVDKKAIELFGEFAVLNFTKC